MQVHDIPNPFGNQAPNITNCKFVKNPYQMNLEFIWNHWVHNQMAVEFLIVVYKQNVIGILQELPVRWPRNSYIWNSSFKISIRIPDGNVWLATDISIRKLDDRGILQEFWSEFWLPTSQMMFNSLTISIRKAKQLDKYIKLCRKWKWFCSIYNTYTLTV